MKREDLEERPFGTIIASGDFPFYAAPEADAVMDAMEVRIKELEAKLKEKGEVMDSCRGLIESANAMSKRAKDKLLNRIKELEAENNSLKADIEVLNDDCRIAKENEVKYHKAYLNELDENARLKAQVPKWISVKDRLPDEGEFILAKKRNGLNGFIHDIDVICFNMTYITGFVITHWMPLPQPPTTEESSATDKEDK